MILTPRPTAATSWSRRSILASLLASVVVAPASATKELTVLFICQFGSVKSATARELFRQRAASRGVRVRAFSRGITPEAHMSPALAAALANEGIEPAHDPLSQLQAGDLKRADMTIIFDKLPPGVHGKKLHDWTDLGSFNDSWATERPRLLARIDALIDELSARA